MKQNLVIVESPAKAKTIEKFLGSDYKRECQPHDCLPTGLSELVTETYTKNLLELNACTVGNAIGINELDVIVVLQG